jgi:hypothetical protein
MQIQNAAIRSTTLGIEGHGILSVMLDLDYGDSSCQGFGGFALDKPTADRAHDSRRRPSLACGLWVGRLLEIAGVDAWEKLKGRSVRVRREDGLNGRIVAIGHYLKDNWFDPAVEFAALTADEPTTAVQR